MLSTVATHHSSPYGGQRPLPHDNSVTKDNQHPQQSKEINTTDSENKVSIEQVSEEDQLVIQKLKQRDQEVKTHEQAHLSAAGGLASGGASFSFTVGPNGVRYATGGEVSIDIARVEGDPAATLRKADTIRRAALAPMSPSSQDQMVAAQATAMASQAQADLSEQIQEKQKIAEKPDTDKNTDSNNKITSEPKLESNFMKGNIIDIST